MTEHHHGAYVHREDLALVGRVRAMKRERDMPLSVAPFRCPARNGFERVGGGA